MKQEQLCDAMNLLPDDIIHEADAVRTQKKRHNKMWLKLVSVAACLCLVVVGTVYMISQEDGNRTVLQWSDSFQAKDYFRYNLNNDGDGVSSSNSISDSTIQYAASRYFSD